MFWKGGSGTFPQMYHPWVCELYLEELENLIKHLLKRLTLPLRHVGDVFSFVEKTKHYINKLTIEMENTTICKEEDQLVIREAVDQSDHIEDMGFVVVPSSIYMHSRVYFFIHVGKKPHSICWVGRDSGQKEKGYINDLNGT
jgi:hypothetical protein